MIVGCGEAEIQMVITFGEGNFHVGRATIQTMHISAQTSQQRLL
jgi:hypothetical protein